MYHSVLPETDNDLTVSLKNLEKQLKYLSTNNYKTLFFKELKAPLKPKTILLTFDDGYKNNEEFLLPLLKKFGMKATIFIPTSRIDHDSDKMTFHDLRNIDKNYVELALHSHNHHNFKEITLDEVEKDLKKNIEVLEKENIPFTKVLAYPYGSFPKNDANFFKILEKTDIEYGLRIGNKANFFPTKTPYQLCRIGINGSDSLLTFILKLIFGKLKL